VFSELYHKTEKKHSSESESVSSNIINSAALYQLVWFHGLLIKTFSSQETGEYNNRDIENGVKVSQEMLWTQSRHNTKRGEYNKRNCAILCHIVPYWGRYRCQEVKVSCIARGSKFRGFRQVKPTHVRGE
jgi:hypothetical protein